MKTLLLITFLTFCSTTFSQDTGEYRVKRISVEKESVINPKLIPETYNVNLIHHEAPLPDGNSVKSHILQQKIKSREKYPIKKTIKPKEKSSTPSPVIGTTFKMERVANGNRYPIFGGIPNDNTLAVSDDGIVLVGINSIIYAYDSNTDSILFSSSYIALQSVANGSSSSNYYDPKIIYDKDADRFILVFLKDTDPATNRIMICFSTTNDPRDDWNVYSLSGNPLNNDRWTDFPAISMTDTDLFITGNLIIPNVSWQVGFDGSVIWQVGKQEGYSGAANLNTVFYDQITFGGNFIRNLHPVQGADGAADKQYLLSNRNFDVTNDSIFVLSIDGTSKDVTTLLSIDVHQSNLNYGMPPNGRQTDTDVNSPTSGLQTNDARVLGAVKIGDNIQFVSNTVNPATGFAAVYHGSITSVNNNPVITANIIGHHINDYGYPNIAWTGNELCDTETMIAFNYTSFSYFPGIACVYYDNDGSYSDHLTIKTGENYIDRLAGSYERWGDYFGLQRQYSKPGTVFSFGYFGYSNRRNMGYCAELIGPDTSRMIMTVEKQVNGNCDQSATVTVNGGVPPYEYSWNNDASNITNTANGICAGDTVVVNVLDARGCSLSKSVYGEGIPLIERDNSIFPNPFSDHFSVQFKLDDEAEITARIYDMSGKIVTDLIQRKAKKGLNELVFSLLPLRVGTYVLKVEANGSEIVNEKIIKNE